MSKKKIIITAVILALVLAIGGILAYFTDVDTKTNSFTMGKIDIEVTETAWPGDEDGVKDIVPNQVVPKNPQVKNKGTNSIYAFVKVVVPYDNVLVEGATLPADTELFSYTVNAGWKELGTATKNTTNKTVTHIYAYVDNNDKVKELAAGATTVAVFNSITFKDIKETSFSSSVLQASQLDVVVSGYGIQTTDLGTNSKEPLDIWALIVDQN